MTTKVLQRPTLILNRNWQPVNVASVARALVLVCRGNARVVDPHDYQLYTWEDWTQLVPNRDEPFVQSVRLRVRVPEVVALTPVQVGSTPTGVSDQPTAGSDYILLRRVRTISSSEGL
jgi:hypothetical protein